MTDVFFQFLTSCKSSRGSLKRHTAHHKAPWAERALESLPQASHFLRPFLQGAQGPFPKLLPQSGADLLPRAHHSPKGGRKKRKETEVRIPKGSPAAPLFSRAEDTAPPRTRLWLWEEYHIYLTKGSKPPGKGEFKLSKLAWAKGHVP